MSEEEKRPSIMIATPMYGGMCTSSYVQGLLDTMAMLSRLQVPVYWAQLTNESLITRGRNELVRLFLEKEQDYLMFIDADIGFDGSAVATLLAADRAVACGIYPKKEINWQGVGRAIQNGRTDIHDFAGSFVFNMEGDRAEADDQGMVEVRHGGTGFMLIKREVFEVMKPTVDTYRRATNRLADGSYAHPETYEFFKTSIDSTGALLSEDYHFCEEWRKLGGTIHANPFIKLSHMGTHMYSGDIMKAQGGV